MYFYQTGQWLFQRFLKSLTFAFAAVAFSSMFLFVCFEVGSHVAQAGIGTLIFLPLTPEYLHLCFEISF